MSILIFCANPDCGDLLTIPETAAGREVRCPICGFVQRVPADAAQMKPMADDAKPQAADGVAQFPAVGGSQGKVSGPAPVTPAPVNPLQDPAHLREPGRPKVPMSPETLGRPPAAAPAPAKPPVPAPAQAPEPAKPQAADGAARPSATDAPKPKSPASPTPKPAPGKEQAPAKPKAAAKPAPVAAKTSAEEKKKEPSTDEAQPAPPAKESAWEDTGLLPGNGPEWKSPIGKAAEISPELKAKLEGRRKIETDTSAEAEAGVYDGDWRSLLLQLKRGPADLLDQPHASALLVALAVLGLVGGTVLANRLVVSHVLLGSYIGAGIGYAAGILLALLLLLAIDQPSARRTQCLYCGHVQPADEESCRFCGWQMYNLRSYVQQCLRAGGFGLSNLRPALAPIGSLVVVILIHGSSGCLAGLYPAAMADKEVYFSVATFLACVVAMVLWLNLLAGAVRASVEGQDRMLLADSSLSRNSLIQAGMALIGLTAYSLPLVTLPILPMLPLRVQSLRGRGGLFDYESLLRQARRQGQELGMLWLMLLLWVAALAMSELVLLKGYQYLLGLLAGPSMLLPLLLQCVTMAAMGAVLGVFLLAVARCIGLLGRHDREFLQPPQPDLERLMG